MDDRKIETMLVAIRKGSFRQAAEELHCTQSAVTQSMNALEEELGFQVFQRNYNGIYLSPKGEEILPYVLKVDSAFKELAKEAETICSGRERPIRIGAFASIANTWLPEAIKAYRNIHEEASFEISIGTNDLVTWMLDGEIDMAIGDASVIHAFRWYPLYTENYIAVVPSSMEEENDTISMDKLLEHPLLLGTVLTLDDQISLSSSSYTAIRSDDDTILVKMVSQGMGVTIIPRLSLKSIAHLPSDVAILNIDPPITRTLGVGLVNHPSKNVMDFSKFLKKNYVK